MVKAPSNSQLLAKLQTIERNQNVQSEDIKVLKGNVQELNTFMLKQVAIDDYKFKFQTGDSTVKQVVNKQMLSDIIKIMGWLAAALLLALQAINK